MEAQKIKRRFIDAPTDMRCQAVVELKDGSTADCGRYRKHGVYCTQHAKIHQPPRRAPT